ncbi:MAG: RraA family protein [Geminicoccaceae bacterium]|nr:RraA family protein [Geminicoccaceae bacterium]
MTDLSRDDLDALVAYDTPTICNALELVAPERRALRFTTRTLICPYPDLKPIVGFAKTAMVRALQPGSLAGAAQRQARLDYYRYVGDGELPKISIVQDLDSREGFGCFWGEVNSAIHKALGCQGLVTNGGVRDLDAIAEGFQVLCGHVTPSHAHVRTVASACEVDIAGMFVRDGDLVHADRHGAVVIPKEVARDVPAAAELCGKREAPILEVARSRDFALEKLEAAMAEAAEIH